MLYLIREMSFLVQKSFSKHKNHYLFKVIPFQNMKKFLKKCFSHHLKELVLKCGKILKIVEKIGKMTEKSLFGNPSDPLEISWFSKFFLEISLSKNLLPDFQIVGTNMLKKLSTLWIIYQVLSVGGKIVEKYEPPPPFFLLNH